LDLIASPDVEVAAHRVAAAADLLASELGRAEDAEQFTQALVAVVPTGQLFDELTNAMRSDLGIAALPEKGRARTSTDWMWTSGQREEMKRVRKGFADNQRAGSESFPKPTS
jgi:hypothetical protein